MLAVWVEMMNYHRPYARLARPGSGLNSYLATRMNYDIFLVFSENAKIFTDFSISIAF
jgi:hypothetical protein